MDYYEKLKAKLAKEIAQDEAHIESNPAVETKGLKEDTKYLSDLKRDGHSRAQEFEVETEDINSELTAFGKVQAILLKKLALGQELLWIGFCLLSPAAY